MWGAAVRARELSNARGSTAPPTANDWRDEEVARQLREGGRTRSADLPNLRPEVLRLAGRRDRALGEESSEPRADGGARNDARRRARTRRLGLDPNETTPAEGCAFKLARESLDEGDDRALQTLRPPRAITRTAFSSLASSGKLPARADARFGACGPRRGRPRPEATPSRSSLSAYTPASSMVMITAAAAHGSSAPRARARDAPARRSSAPPASSPRPSRPGEDAPSPAVRRLRHRLAPPPLSSSTARARGLSARGIQVSAGGARASSVARQTEPALARSGHSDERAGRRAARARPGPRVSVGGASSRRRRRRPTNAGAHRQGRAGGADGRARD